MLSVSSLDLGGHRAYADRPTEMLSAPSRARGAEVSALSRPSHAAIHQPLAVPVPRHFVQPWSRRHPNARRYAPGFVQVADDSTLLHSGLAREQPPGFVGEHHRQPGSGVVVFHSRCDRDAARQRNGGRSASELPRSSSAGTWPANIRARLSGSRRARHSCTAARRSFVETVGPGHAPSPVRALAPYGRC